MVYSLRYDKSHYGPDDTDDGWIEDFPGINDTGLKKIRFHMLNKIEISQKIIMWTPFDYILKYTDYPDCDRGGWPIMSKKMLKVLLDVKPFPHKTFPIVMKDSVEDHNYENNDYVIVQLLQHERNLIDLNNSILEIDEEIDMIVPSSIDKLILKKPIDGFPSLFRLSQLPANLFVSNDAKNALEKYKIKGLRFINIENFS